MNYVPSYQGQTRDEENNNPEKETASSPWLVGAVGFVGGFATTWYAYQAYLAYERYQFALLDDWLDTVIVDRYPRWTPDPGDDIFWYPNHIGSDGTVGTVGTTGTISGYLPPAL